MKPTKKVILYYKASAEGITILGAKDRVQANCIFLDTIDGRPVVAIEIMPLPSKRSSPWQKRKLMGELTLCLATEERTAVPREAEGDALMRIVLPDTIRRIGAYAFMAVTPCGMFFCLKGWRKLRPIPFRAVLPWKH